MSWREDVDIDREMAAEGVVPDFDETKKCQGSYETAENCRGEISTRRSAGGTCWVDRCETHWIQHDAWTEEHNRRYPYHRPSDFDEADAGERWEDDY